jgi:hypothetical protein
MAKNEFYSATPASGPRASFSNVKDVKKKA